MFLVCCRRYAYSYCPWRESNFSFSVHSPSQHWLCYPGSQCHEFRNWQKPTLRKFRYLHVPPHCIVLSQVKRSKCYKAEIFTSVWSWYSIVCKLVKKPISYRIFLCSNVIFQIAIFPYSSTSASDPKSNRPCSDPEHINLTSTAMSEMCAEDFLYL